PFVTSFSPTNAAVGTSVTIDGINFAAGMTVRFYNGKTASAAVTSGTQLQATVPTGATTGPITVFNASGTNTTTSNFVVTGTAPLLYSFSPGNGPTNTSVQLEGGNFVTGTRVFFNGRLAASTNIVSSTQMRATVPSGATTGLLVVSNSSGAVTSSVPYYVWPRIDGFTPTNGITGSSITVTGANFLGATNFSFNGVSTTNFTVNNATNLTAVVPAAAISGTLSVTTPAGITASTNIFRVLPNITGFSPVRGPVGTSVLILGSGFSDLASAGAVRFAGVASTSTNLINSQQILGTVPAAATNGPISVTTSNGTATSPTSFIVTPSITSFSPTNGPPGTVVSIFGTTFQTVTIVRFGGAPSFFTNMSSTRIDAVVPPDASTGVITLTNPDGSVDSTKTFLVHPELFITPLTNNNVLLSWYTWASGFSLEFSTNMIWSPVPDAPVTSGFEKFVTNSAASGQKFYRLKRN
ncbi:MAG TPA: IPT/TIG domain-containing protein, partial [Roseimicrobium sp.]|nr:IPT/TIG domain-containing protein [Roseimicrobium sp.]